MINDIRIVKKLPCFRRLTNEPSTTTVIENERLREPIAASAPTVHTGNNHVGQAPAPIASPEQVLTMLTLV